MKNSRKVPGQSKPGILHCQVTRVGHVAFAGEPRDIADGESYSFRM